MSTRIDRPSLNRKNAEANLAIVDRWIAETSDKLNAYMQLNDVKRTEYEKTLAECVLSIDRMADIVDNLTRLIVEEGESS